MRNFFSKYYTDQVKEELIGNMCGIHGRDDKYIHS
jgi:hypothetical protein